jgi:putative intracellular protease/amidase
LIVIPRANVAGLRARIRFVPNRSPATRDLNRNCPKTYDKNETVGELAAGIWRLVEERKPDWLLDLHEGTDFYQINKKSVGSSIIPTRGVCVAQFDLVVFPGGSGSRQAAALEQEGRGAVWRFVEAGGGYLGVCVGAYLAAGNGAVEVVIPTLSDSAHPEKHPPRRIQTLPYRDFAIARRVGDRCFSLPRFSSIHGSACVNDAGIFTDRMRRAPAVGADQLFSDGLDPSAMSCSR